MTALDHLSFLIESNRRPYFSNPVKKLLWLFPEGLIATGRSYTRPWLTVTIEAVGPPPRPSDRGRRFFSDEPGITALSVQVKPGVSPPLVVGFRENEPMILFDMRQTVDNDVAQLGHLSLTNSDDAIRRPAVWRSPLLPMDARLDVAPVHYVPAKDERMIRDSTQSSSQESVGGGARLAR